MKDMFPYCASLKCASCDDFRCLALSDNDFGTKKCPFFKTKEQVEQEKEYCRNRLADIRIGGKYNA